MPITFAILFCPYEVEKAFLICRRKDERFLLYMSNWDVRGFTLETNMDDLTTAKAS